MDEPVGVFACSTVPGAVGVSEEDLYARVSGEALVAGLFPPVIPVSVFVSLLWLGPGYVG